MNILFLFHSTINPSVGGVERVTHLLGSELKSRGHNVIFLSTGNVEPYKQSGIEQLWLNFDINKKETTDRYLKILADYNIEVVINQQSTPESIYLLRHTPSEVRRITCCHVQPFPFGGKERKIISDIYPSDLPRKLFKWLCTIFPFVLGIRANNNERKSLLSAAKVSDKLILLSEKFIPRIKKYCHEFPLEKIDWANNPNITVYEESPDLTKKEKLIVYVGRLAAPQKNLKSFIDFWKKFSEGKPDWKASIIGDGPTRHIYESYALTSGCRNLKFEGQQEDVSSIYRRAAFVCLTSIYEGWGMVLTEGMSHGCIPVCFDSYESCHDIIDNGINGIIVEPFDTTEMAARVCDIASDKEKFDTMAINAAKKVEKFDIKNIVNKWESILSQLK